MIRQTLQFALARGVPGLIAFLGLPFLTRVLTPEQFGAYALVIGWVGLLNSLLFSWLRHGLLRLHSSPEGPDVLHATIIRSYVAVGTAVSVLALGIGWLFASHSMLLLTASGLMLLLAQAWFELNQQLAASLQDPRRYGSAALTRAVLSMTAALGAGLYGFGAVGVLVAFAVGYAVPALTSLSMWRVGFATSPRRSVFTRLVKYGFPLALSMGLTFIIGYSDRQMIAQMRSLGEAAQYAAAYDLAEQSLGLLMSFVALAAHPIIMRTYEAEGWIAAKAPLRRSAVIILAAIVPATAGLCTLAPKIAGLALGGPFQDVASKVIPWVSIAVAAIGFKSYYLDLAFLLSGRTATHVGINATGAAFNVMLNLVLIPAYGLMGAAYATAASYTGVTILSRLRGRALLDLPLPWRELFQVSCSTLLMCVVLQVIRSGGLALLVMVGAITYALGALFFDLLGCRGRMLKVLRAYAR